MLKYLRDKLARDRIPAERVAAYRGGYLPELRRSIERGLREGELSCVVATSALELGIDIGALDAVVCAGYPGTLASLWQRFGRGGRRGGESLALLVGSSAPLDQYVTQHPQYLLAGPVEEARIDPDNAEILVQHVKCAAFELPFAAGEAFRDVPGEVVQDALDYLSDHRLLHAAEGRDGKNVYTGRATRIRRRRVAAQRGLGQIGVIDVERDKTIAEMDFRATQTMLHEQAIYQHEGEQYQVERPTSTSTRRSCARSRRTTTRRMTHVRVSVLEREDEATLGDALCERGESASWRRSSATKN